MSDPAGADAYLARLQKITTHVDPNLESDASKQLRAAGATLADLDEITHESVVEWAKAHPKDVNALGLTVGLSREKLGNQINARFGTTSWAKVAKEQPDNLVTWFTSEFDLLESLQAQHSRQYNFGDILVARGTSRQTAGSAGLAGKSIEDKVESIVIDLGLPYEMRGRFTGRRGETGPADVAIPDFERTQIAIACKGFDSTGSKLTAAVSEVELMEQVRHAHQYIFAVVDGIGWNARKADFRRMFALAEDGRINGLYALADLDRFREDLRDAAVRVKLLP
jgi:hypothetical protein